MTNQTTTTTAAIPASKTLAAFRAAGWKETGTRTFERGYIHVADRIERGCPEEKVYVYEAGGRRKGQWYYLTFYNCTYSMRNYIEPRTE